MSFVFLINYLDCYLLVFTSYLHLQHHLIMSLVTSLAVQQHALLSYVNHYTLTFIANVFGPFLFPLPLFHFSVVQPNRVTVL